MSFQCQKMKEKTLFSSINHKKHKDIQFTITRQEQKHFFKMEVGVELINLSKCLINILSQWFVTPLVPLDDLDGLKSKKERDVVFLLPSPSEHQQILQSVNRTCWRTHAAMLFPETSHDLWTWTQRSRRRCWRSAAGFLFHNKLSRNCSHSTSSRHLVTPGHAALGLIIGQIL